MTSPAGTHWRERVISSASSTNGSRTLRPLCVVAAATVTTLYGRGGQGPVSSARSLRAAGAVAPP
eukprot:138014-Chlamydomonas_euryale.AAC.5